MRTMRCWAASVAMLLAMGSAQQAAATEFCLLKETRDGFIALRAGPGPDYRPIAKMTPGDEVLFSVFPQDSRGKWQKVRWWRGDTRLTLGFGKTSGEGWVHRDLVGDCG